MASMEFLGASACTYAAHLLPRSRACGPSGWTASFRGVSNVRSCMLERRGDAIIESILIGASVGLVAGLVPGAFSTLVATTALERGMGPGLKVALIPLATELPVMLAAVFVLTRLPVQAFRWIGVAGGILFILMAAKLLWDSRDGDPVSAEAQAHGGHFLRVAILGVMSPGPWVFWFFVGAPILLNRWRMSPGQGLLFLAAFMACFIGAMLVLAWGVASGRRLLNLLWYRRTLKAASAVLVLAGIILMWQSWVGNFTEMVQAPGGLQ